LNDTTRKEQERKERKKKIIRPSGSPLESRFSVRLKHHRLVSMPRKMKPEYHAERHNPAPQWVSQNLSADANTI
jgi:hypothetical protein